MVRKVLGIGSGEVFLAGKADMLAGQEAEPDFLLGLADRRRAGDEQAGDLRRPRQHLDPDMAAERPPDHRDAADIEGGEHLQRRFGIGGHAVGAAGIRRIRRLSMARQVHGEAAVLCADRAGHLVAKHLLAGRIAVDEENSGTLAFTVRDGDLRMARLDPELFHRRLPCAFPVIRPGS